MRHRRAGRLLYPNWLGLFTLVKWRLSMPAETATTGQKDMKRWCIGATNLNSTPVQVTIPLFTWSYIFVILFTDEKKFPVFSSDEPQASPDSGGVVNTNEAFCTVVQTRLAEHKLLFSGEVDCREANPQAPPAPACYIELKTSAEIHTPKQRSNLHRSEQSSSSFVELKKQSLRLLP